MNYGYTIPMQYVNPQFIRHYGLKYTRGDQKVRGKELLNSIAYIDCNENS